MRNPRKNLANLDELKQSVEASSMFLEGQAAGGETYAGFSIRSFAILYRMLCSEIFRTRAALD